MGWREGLGLGLVGARERTRVRRGAECFADVVWGGARRSPTHTSPSTVQVRAKMQLKYNILQQMDGTSPTAEEIGRQMITFGRRMNLAETFARIDAIEPADVQRVAEAIIWDQEVAFAGLGPNLKTVGDLNHLRRGTYWNRL